MYLPLPPIKKEGDADILCLV
jgi:hypothetical protein